MLSPIMKSRRRQHSPRTKPHHKSPKFTPKPPQPRPEKLVARIEDSGPPTLARVLNRDLATLTFKIESTGQTLPRGTFIECTPTNTPLTLKVEKILPATSAATWAAVCNFNLPTTFPPAVQQQAEQLKPYQWHKSHNRTDWRHLPIVTIDGEDARDFDDAVYAEPLKGGGHKIIVAIADVAHYVEEDSPLDKEALLRGNSTYFPNLVIPMLPEQLSNNLCSLRPHEDRPVLGVEMHINAQGTLTKHTFHRAVIHSHARLTYTQLQNALNGSGQTHPWLAGAQGAQAAKSLLAAYQTLAQAKRERGALDLNIPELKLELDASGKVQTIAPRPRLTSHQIIEELMILANVAAATTLSKHGGGALYRIHAPPSVEKLTNLKTLLAPLGFTAPAANATPKAWAFLVEKLSQHPAAPTLLRAILQSQQQAKYEPENIGHYGLALPLYSHFTSPIRRYADLVVHRALIKAHKLETPGNANKPLARQSALLSSGRDGGQIKLTRIAETINLTERRSQQAEWEARDRMVAEHLQGKVGQTFTGTITGVQPYGCFVAIDGLAEGLLPKWHLGEGWQFVPTLNLYRQTNRSKTNKQKATQLRAGTTLQVVLTEADPLAARLTFSLPESSPTSLSPRRPAYFP